MVTSDPDRMIWRRCATCRNARDDRDDCTDCGGFGMLAIPLDVATDGEILRLLDIGRAQMEAAFREIRQRREDRERYAEKQERRSKRAHTIRVKR